MKLEFSEEKLMNLGVFFFPLPLFFLVYIYIYIYLSRVVVLKAYLACRNSIIETAKKAVAM